MPEYLVTSGLPSYPAGLADKEASLVLPLYRAVNNLSQSMSALSGNVQYSVEEMQKASPVTKLVSDKRNSIFAKAHETMNFGTVVSIFSSAGVLTARKADHAVPRGAHGIVNNVNGVTVGNYCEILFMSGHTLGITGSVIGQPYWLSTGGQVQASKPTSGIIQPVGWGLGTDGFYLNIELPQ